MPDNQKDVLFYEVITQLIEAQNQGKKLGNYVALDAAFKKHGPDSKQEYDTLITDPNFEENIQKGTKEILDLAAQATHLFQKNQAQPVSPTTEYRDRQKQKNAITRSSSAKTIAPPPPPKVSVQDRIKKWETMGTNKNPTRTR